MPPATNKVAKGKKRKAAEHAAELLPLPQPQPLPLVAGYIVVD
jgi:hypothetical protein